jgi:Flp pilus assembly protein CpaB
MVMTRPTNDGTGTDVQDAAPRRVVTRAPGVPGSRAVVGGALIALAALGTFLSWQQATGTPQHSYAVADRTLEPGDPLAAADIRFEPIDLPAGVSAGAFRSAGDLEGRVLVAPVGEGELLQRGSLSDQGTPDPAAEVSVALDRELAVDGRLRAGDTVDVYATHDDDTVAVARDIRVIAVTEGGGTFADGSELTVTLALAQPDQQVPVIHAARAGQITLVRTTHVPRSSSSTGTDASAADTPASTAQPPASPGGGG